MLLSLLRGCFLAIIIGTATYALVYFQNRGGDNSGIGFGIAAFCVVTAFGFGAVLVDVFVKNKEITTISAVYFGLVLGLVLGWMFSYALEPFLGEGRYKELAQPVKLLLTLVCCYISISTLLQTK